MKVTPNPARYVRFRFVFTPEIWYNGDKERKENGNIQDWKIHPRSVRLGSLVRGQHLVDISWRSLLTSSLRLDCGQPVDKSLHNVHTKMGVSA